MVHFGIPVPDQELEPVRVAAEVHQQIAGLLDRPLWPSPQVTVHADFWHPSTWFVAQHVQLHVLGQVRADQHRQQPNRNLTNR
jgi:hypothetical protein